MTSERKPAMRTCLGCRLERPQEEMIRMVRTPEGLTTFDPGRKLPGRGAYVCPTRGCVNALEGKRLSRAFRAPTSPPRPESLVADLERLYRRRSLEMLGLAARAGSLVRGRDAVQRGLEAGRILLLVAARDLSPRSVRELARPEGEPALVFLSTVSELGPAIGRPGTGILGVTSASLAEALIHDHHNAASLGLVI